MSIMSGNGRIIDSMVVLYSIMVYAKLVVQSMSISMAMRGKSRIIDSEVITEIDFYSMLYKHRSIEQ